MQDCIMYYVNEMISILTHTVSGFWISWSILHH